METIVVVGLAALISIAILVGVHTVEERASGKAWRGVAEERRRNWETARRVEELYDAMEWCEHCPFQRAPAVTHPLRTCRSPSASDT